MAQTASRPQYRLVLDNRILETDDPEISGRDVLNLGRYRPASDFSVVLYANAGTQVLGLDETIRLDIDTSPVLRAFKGDRLFRATLNEREVVWGDDEISAADLRVIGEISDDQDLYLDSDGDRLIPDDGKVRLRREGVERIRSGDPHDATLHIILNGEQVTVEKGRISFSELAKLAFPKLFGRDQVCFTVSFSRGPKRRPEGSLLEGRKIRVVEGMVFNVSATDKS